MSETLTVQCFQHGSYAKFPREIFWSPFAPYAERAAFEGWDLRFPDGSLTHLSIDDDKEIDGFGMERPSSGILFDIIFSILSRVPAIMIVSSDGFCCVADEKVLLGLPDWLLKALPPPKVVDSGRTIVEFLSGKRGSE